MKTMKIFITFYRYPFSRFLEVPEEYCVGNERNYVHLWFHLRQIYEP